MSFVKYVVRSAVCGVLFTSVAAAQGPTVTNPPLTQEYGIDAGAVIGLGDQSSVSLTLPAARARAAFYLNNDSRWAIEPAAGLSYTKPEGVPSTFVYNLEVGALYHFAPPARVADIAEANRVSVAYVRPFIGLTGTTIGGGGENDNEVSAGAGLGVKIPWRDGLAWRLEANLGYGFDNEAFRLGAFAGLSFFTRDLIPVGR